MESVLAELYTYWIANPDIWFGCTSQIDQELTDKYETYILQDYNYEDILLNKVKSIGLIIPRLILRLNLSISLIPINLFSISNQISFSSYESVLRRLRVGVLEISGG